MAGPRNMLGKQSAGAVNSMFSCVGVQLASRVGTCAHTTNTYTHMQTMTGVPTDATTPEVTVQHTISTGKRQQH